MLSLTVFVKLQVKILIQRSAGDLCGLLFLVWRLLVLVDTQFTSTVSGYVLISRLIFYKYKISVLDQSIWSVFKTDSIIIHQV